MIVSISRAFVSAAAAVLIAAPALAQTPNTVPKEIAHMNKTSAPSQAVNADYNQFLSKYVVEDGLINLVKYDKVTAEDKAILDGYIDKLSKAGPPNGSEAAILAYWFNLYNAKTVSVIVDNYPVKSIREIGGGLFSPGPWDDKNMVVAGKAMSLNDIEHGTVRATYDEPRIHYGFNCASIGCPNLKTTAWTEENFEEDLVKAARDFIESPRGISVDNKGRIKASEIFKWYKEDFGGSDAGVLSHTAEYASGDTKAALLAAKKIHKFDYDWSLNIAK